LPGEPVSAHVQSPVAPESFLHDVQSMTPQSSVINAYLKLFLQCLIFIFISIILLTLTGLSTLSGLSGRVPHEWSPTCQAA
jgi:hypothetical protein